MMAEKTDKETDKDRLSRLALRVMRLSRDALLVHLRFLDAALARLALREQWGLSGAATDGEAFYYDPAYVLRLWQQEENAPARLYLHSLLHCIFRHPFGYEKLEGELWDLAADIAVERTILELELPCAGVDSDGEAAGKLKVLREDIGVLGAERIYRHFRKEPPSRARMDEYRRVFARDLHTLWKPAESYELTREDWQKISRRVRAELKSFSKTKGAGETLRAELESANRERYDYAALLRSFAVMGENLAVNDDEFDYIYYTYGLRTYGNLPLVEPLESREEKKVREFVIALDTSASTSGELVRGFLRRTWELLRSEESFFKKINVHILQCDSEIQNDTLVTSQEEFEAFLREGKLTGYGATDFRPVFDYVDDLRDAGAFENLRGLIYFTDGYGIYPARMPDYEVLFAFLGEDETRPAVPPWSRRVVLEEEELERARTFPAAAQGKERGAGQTDRGEPE